MKRYWSQIAKLPVQVDEESPVLGRLNAVFIHPDNGQVIAYLVGVLKVLVPIDIHKWTTNYVLITEEEALVSPAEIHRLADSGFFRAFFNGKFVRSKSGARYGRLRDFELDLTTDRLIRFECSRRFLGFEWGKRIFEWKDVDHISERAVVVIPEPETKKRIKKNPGVPAEAF